MEEGVYKIEIDFFDGVLGVNFCVVRLTPKAFAFYPLEKISDNRYRVMENPEPLIFNEDIDSEIELELEKGDLKKPDKVADLEDIVNLGDYI